MNSTKRDTGAARNRGGTALDIAYLAGFCLLCAGAALANLHLGAIRGAGILVCGGGSLAYVVFQKLKKIDHSRTLDYQQSGEAALAAIVYIALAGFAARHALAASAVLFASLISYELYAHSYLRLERRENATVGLVMTILAGVLFLFLLTFDSSFNPSAVRGVFLPFATDIRMDIRYMAVIAFALALYVLATISSPELSLLSQGRGYSENGGVPYRAVFALAECAKGICVALVMLSLGWMGGAAGYIPAPRTQPVFIADAMLLLTAFLYAQILLFLAVIWTAYGALAISILVSWGAYILKYGIGDSIHDRTC